MVLDILELGPISKLNKDLKIAAATLSPQEARYLVDMYYQLQKYRITTGNQIKAMSEEPHSVIAWANNNFDLLEHNIQRALDAYTNADPVGAWSKSIMGIGPILAAGLLAHIDITQAPTVGHIWSFAGLVPNVGWGKGQKRPWNARLKTLCWKIGESFVKVSNNPNDFYGHLYRQRKEYELTKNEAGEYAEQAAEKLKNFKIGKDTDAYKAYNQGNLPPAHINERAKRWAVKLFLAHWHTVAYWNHYGEAPPKPYPEVILGHVHIIGPPHFNH